MKVTALGGSPTAYAAAAAATVFRLDVDGRGVQLALPTPRELDEVRGDDNRLTVVCRGRVRRVRIRYTWGRRKVYVRGEKSGARCEWEDGSLERRRVSFEDWV